MDEKALKHLREEAVHILRKNDTGRFTKPAPRLYPHQWNWDSVFNAIGWLHIDEDRAWLELDSLLTGQWKHGMVPHIVFDPEIDAYHPGPDYWNTSVSPMAPDHVLTSGITQPPLLAYGTWYIFQRARYKDKALQWLKRLYPRIRAFHDFLHAKRDMEGKGVVAILHPWESGQDNSPRWDAAMNAIQLKWIPEYRRIDNTLVPPEQRPTDEDYDRYSYLVEVFRKVLYDPRALWEESPFLIQPVLFNSIFLASDRCLKKMSEILGEENGEIDAWIQNAQAGISAYLWDERLGSYCDLDLRTGVRIWKRTLSGFFPLFAKIPHADQAGQMVETLMDFWPENGYPFCTVARDEAEYNPGNYWRGPVWINMNWMLILGLKAYGYEEEAALVVSETLRLVEEHGFYEYFHPQTGKGFGSDDFSWSASLVLDLIGREFWRPRE